MDEVITFILQRYTDNAPLAVQSLHNAALEWEDALLWTRAVGICSEHGGLTVFPDFKEIFKAIEAFGFEVVRPGYVRKIYSHHAY